MNTRRLSIVALALVYVAGVSSPSAAQSPGEIYSWDNSGNAEPNTEQWIRNFGAANTSATLDNANPGLLTIVETSAAAGASQAFTDGFNRIRESSINSSGGLDLTGLNSLRFELGHNGSSPVNVQFFVQASTGSNFVALGADLSVAPGMNFYDVPLAGLTANQLVYIRTLGLNIRDHASMGNLVWSLGSVSSVGTPLAVRDLITHDTGSAEGGLQGAIVNFDNAAVQGNNGGQNQTGLSHNANGSGSMQWVDLGGGPGAAISWGNGTAWNGNTFNNRSTDLSNYSHMIVRMSAEDLSGAGGLLGVQGFFQKNGFQFSGAGSQNLAIDGQFHDLTFDLAGLTNMNVVELTGINLNSHANDLRINVDNIRFVAVPEPGTIAVLGMAVAGCLRLRRRN